MYATRSSPRGPRVKPTCSARARAALGWLLTAAAIGTAGTAALAAAASVRGTALDATSTPDTAHCVDARSLDLRRILPPPPAAGSQRERAELAELERIQAARTQSEAEHAREDAKITLFRFADALGDDPAFTATRLPHTVALFHHLSVDERAVLTPAKREFGRLRPYTVDPRLEPVTARPESLSYPSGHSLWAYTTALVLADMVPERRAQLLARADQYAHERSIAGVHYPSDVEAGRLAGTALAALLFACPAFGREEAAARVELRGALGLRARVSH